MIKPLLLPLRSILLDTESFGDAEILNVWNYDLDNQSTNNQIVNISTDGQRLTFDALKSGNATITVRVNEDANYEQSTTKTIYIQSYNSSTLDDYSPNNIYHISGYGIAPNLFKVGDVTADIPMSGQISAGGTKLSSNYRAVILGFNHNPSIEGNNTIHFALGRHTNGTDIDFIDNNYGGMATSGWYTQHKKASTASNSGGWNSSGIRQYVLPKFLNAMPSEWQNVIRACTKYTDNTGGTSGSASNMTTTSDSLWLLSQYEVVGSTSTGNNNAAEATYQMQYDYYKSRNGVRYKHNSTSTMCKWWFRTPSTNNAKAYRTYRSSTSVAAGREANYCYGIVPCFVI